MSESGEEESRSDRLRQRRSARQDSAQDGSSESSEPSQRSEPDETGESTEPSKGSVKEEQVGTYMYLPKSQKKEIERLYSILKADFEYEFDTEFEKNRHFFPLLVQYGLDGLDGLDASEVKERLDSM